MVSGLPRTITMHSDEIGRNTERVHFYDCSCRKIGFGKTPPELSADIIDRACF